MSNDTLKLQLISTHFTDLTLTHCGRSWWQKRLSPGTPSSPSTCFRWVCGL